MKFNRNSNKQLTSTILARACKKCIFNPIKIYIDNEFIRNPVRVLRSLRRSVSRNMKKRVEEKFRENADKTRGNLYVWRPDL